MMTKGINNFKRITPILLVIFVILSTDTLITAQNSNFYYLRIAQIITIIIVLYWIIKSDFRRVVISRESILIFITTIMLVLSMIINRDFTGGYFILIINLLFGYFFSKRVSFTEFARRYIKIMLFLSIFSLLCFLLTPFLCNLSILPTITNHNGLEYKNLFFTTIYSSGLMRNMGPFWEPGVYQIYLIVALLFSVYFDEILWHKIVLAMAILTTFSTTGYISLILVFCLYTLKKDISKKKKKKYLLILVGAFAGIIFLLSPIAQRVILEKFQNNSYSMSLDSRTISVFINLMAFKNNLFFGVGPKNIDNFTTLYLDSIDYNGYYGFICNTNTLLLYFAMFGLTVGIFFLYCIWRGIKVMRDNVLSKVILILLIIIETSSEPLTYSLLCSVLFIYGLRAKKVKN